MEEELLDLPSIDLQGKEAAIKLWKAHKEHGFFYIVNHGIEHDMLDQVLHQSNKFFGQPIVQKLAFRAPPGYRKEGYCPAAGVDNLACGGYDPSAFHREQVYYYIKPIASRNMSRWPTNLRGVMEQLGASALEVCEKIMHLLAEALGIPTRELREALGKEMRQTVCTFKYFKSTSMGALGIPEHTDIGSLVFLFSENVPGLQIQKEGQWRTVKPQPHALVVSIGEALEVLSNGKYSTTKHRVLLNKDMVRHSCAITFEPAMDADIGPLKMLISKDQSILYRRYIYKDRYDEYIEGKSDKKFAFLASSNNLQGISTSY